MRAPIRYFVNHKTRMCQMLTGPAQGEEHLANIKQALKDGFVEVADSDELEAFRDVTRTAKAQGWNPDRMRYDTWMKKTVDQSMTNKLEITRELAGRIVKDGAASEAQIDQLRKALAAPVVERQMEPVCIYWDAKTQNCLDAKAEPPLIQTLHANGDRIAMEATIAQQAQKIADLERGRGEPVAWGVNSDLAAIKDGALWSGTLWGKKSIPPFEERSPLYASPPAPVAVVLPDRAAFEAWRDRRNASIAESGGSSSWYVSQAHYATWEAAINKVKELNQ